MVHKRFTSMKSRWQITDFFSSTFTKMGSHKRLVACEIVAILHEKCKTFDLFDPIGMRSRKQMTNYSGDAKYGYCMWNIGTLHNARNGSDDSLMQEMPWHALISRERYPTCKKLTVQEGAQDWGHMRHGPHTNEPPSEILLHVCYFSFTLYLKIVFATF